MPPLIGQIVFLLTISTLFTVTTAFSKYAAQRVPLGGSLFNLESRRLLERQDNNAGTNCGDDPACIMKDFGCSCDFQDGSWMDNPAIAASATSSTPTANAPAPPNASPTCTHTANFGCNCSDGSHPAQDEDGRCCLGGQCFNADTGPPAAPAPPPPSAAPPSPQTPGPAITCKVNGNGCDCTDGSHPIQDEHGRCCISEDSTGHNYQCFS